MRIYDYENIELYREIRIKKTKLHNYRHHNKRSQKPNFNKTRRKTRFDNK